MNVVAIVQARMGSTRLPGKVLAEISGKPMLVRVIERLQRCRTLGTVVVATTTVPEDHVVADVVRRIGGRCFRGATEDVLQRYVAAARWCDADLVVRITADCPLIDPAVVDRVVEAIQERPCVDYCSNVVVRTYPRGLDCEAFWLDTLLRLDRYCTDPVDREHVTRYLLRALDVHGLFSFRSVTDTRNNSDLRWTVDTADDLAAMRRIYERLDGRRRDDLGSLPHQLVVRQVRADPDLVWLDR